MTYDNLLKLKSEVDAAGTSWDTYFEAMEGEGEPEFTRLSDLASQYEKEYKVKLAAFEKAAGEFVTQIMELQ